MNLQGFRRNNDAVGCRNHVLVLPTVQCANRIAEVLPLEIPGVIGVPHVWGCTFGKADNHSIERTLVGYGSHPNVYATLLVSLGCETVSPPEIAQRIAQTGKPVEVLSIQQEGGTTATLDRARALCRQWMTDAASCQRTPCTVEDLIVGLECGGSDAFSGLSANPAVGVASDGLVRLGGTVILSETPELVGAEHLLAERCVSEQVREQLLAAVASAELRFARSSKEADGVYVSPGNMEGGLTTIAEKSLGCVHKGGSTPVEEVLTYAQAPSRPGLVVMDTPGYDVSSVTGMVAGGAQLVLFTTGRGSPTGNSLAPVIKICSNSATFARMSDNMEVNAGAVLDGDQSLAGVGETILAKVEAVFNGELTRAEVHGHREFAISAPSVYYCRQETV